MITVCVLRSGGIYTETHVSRLIAQVPNILCLSDIPFSSILADRRIPLQYEWPGWWSKIEVFNPRLNEDILYIDLDSEIVGDLSKLISIGENSKRSIMWTDPIRPKYANSSVMWIKQTEKAAVWDRFRKNPAGFMKSFCFWPDKWGDQGFISSCLPDAGRWPEGLVRSWRLECRKGIKEGTVLLSFHGKPKPWDVTINRSIIPGSGRGSD